MNYQDAEQMLYYCALCLEEGFTGINNYKRIQATREILHRFNMQTLAVHTLQVLEKSAGKKRVSLLVNYGQQITLADMIKRVEIPGTLQPITNQIFNH